MQLLFADYLLIGLATVMAITGLFRGFSGTIAFFIAVVAGVTSGIISWTYAVDYTNETWIRALVTLAIALIAFGLIRIIVRKLVNGLLAQPSDAIFGFLIGVLFGAAIIVGWAASDVYLEHSNLASEVAKYLK